MTKLSHAVIASLSILTLLWSILLIAVGTYAVIGEHDECLFYEPAPDIIQGVLLFIHSMIGIIGGLRGNRLLLMIYAGMMFAWTLYFLGSSLFWYILSLGGSKAAKEHKEYQLDQYPKWVRNRVFDDKSWAKHKKCWAKEGNCKRMILRKDKRHAEIELQHSPLLFSCCQPPLYCGFENKNGISWEASKSANSTNLEDADCKAWSDDLDKVCYDCDSCKAGLIRATLVKWGYYATSDFIWGIVIAVISIIAYCAFRQAPVPNMATDKSPPPV